MLISDWSSDVCSSDLLCACVTAAGHAAHILPTPVGGLRPWLDCCFDLLVINPFLGWQEPFEFVRLARSIAGRRPLLILSDRDSLDDRMIALTGGADDAGGWTPNLPDLLEIGRASGRERGCQYVYISGVAD